MTKFTNWWAGEIAPLYYQSAKGSGEYLGSAPADPSPMEPGVWLLPADALWDAPPALAEHQAAVYRNGGWEIVPDYRGEVRYRKGDFVEVVSLGEPADPPMVVHDAWWVLPEGNADLDGARLAMAINDDVIEFNDAPHLMARRVLAGWEAQGGQIRPIAFDADTYEPDVLVDDPEAAAASRAAVDAAIDERVRLMLEGGSGIPRAE